MLAVIHQVQVKKMESQQVNVEKLTSKCRKANKTKDKALCRSKESILKPSKVNTSTSNKCASKFSDASAKKTDPTNPHKDSSDNEFSPDDISDTD